MRRAHGYSLIEMLVVMAILGVLAGLSIPVAEVAQQRERERELRRALWEIRDAIDAYRHAREQGAIAPVGSGTLYPPTLKALTQPHADLRVERRGQVLRFLRQVPRDPFADARVSPEESWGLRSFASSAEQPLPGVDVYDVYSRSTRIGLNGVPLRQW